MNNTINQHFPKRYQNIIERTELCGFTMASDVLTCSLLRTLAASKINGVLLELGTGSGLATSWILDGMDAGSTLTSIDNDAALLEIARHELGSDKRLHLILSDGGKWIEENKSKKHDFIFADTWHGKFLLLDETLQMLTRGGLYILDDMLPQPNWPDGHSEKVDNLISYLESREDLQVTKQVWSTGIVIAVKK
jgi:predicted O-methyltransferase YrrM